MNTYTEKFKGRAFSVFDTKEINEALLMAYGELSSAIRDGSDTIILNRKVLAQIAKGHTLREWKMVYGSTSIYDAIRKNLLIILERDSVVQQFFELVDINEDSLTLKVKAH